MLLSSVIIIIRLSLRRASNIEQYSILKKIKLITHMVSETPVGLLVDLWEQNLFF